jgi:NitT/TauT family transport system substrate-binding protein
MSKTKVSIIALLIVVVAVAAYVLYRKKTTQLPAQLVQVRFGISPFQDTLVPIVGQEKGWYREEGLDVDMKVLGWTEIMEALSAGQLDVAINNESAVVATNQRNPNIVYWYATNPFDNGFALMIRPDGKLKTLQQVKKDVADHQLAVKTTAAQLKGKTVITTGKTDMEQGVSAAARRGELDFKKDVKIIDLNPDEGLAAFLRGEGDAYIGGIPQRTRAGKEGMLEMLTGSDLGPPPMNGFVTTKQYAAAHQDELLKLLRIWFKTVKYVDQNDDGANIIIKHLNSYSAAQFTLTDFRKFWNNYEHYPSSPREVQSLILDSTGKNYWKARWDDCNLYFYQVTGAISKPVDPNGVFVMEDAQRAYVARYGWE